MGVLPEHEKLLHHHSAELPRNQISLQLFIKIWSCSGFRAGEAHSQPCLSL
jgi:hypothetical protein